MSKQPRIKRMDILKETWKHDGDKPSFHISEKAMYILSCLLFSISVFVTYLFFSQIIYLVVALIIAISFLALLRAGQDLNVSIRKQIARNFQIPLLPFTALAWMILLFIKALRGSTKEMIFDAHTDDYLSPAAQYPILRTHPNSKKLIGAWVKNQTDINQLRSSLKGNLDETERQFISTALDTLYQESEAILSLAGKWADEMQSKKEMTKKRSSAGKEDDLTERDYDIIAETINRDPEARMRLEE